MTKCDWCAKNSQCSPAQRRECVVRDHLFFVQEKESMRYFFYCPHCLKESIMEQLPSQTSPNLREDHGVPVYRYRCPRCGNLDAGIMPLYRMKLPEEDRKEYFRAVISRYQNIMMQKRAAQCERCKYAKDMLTDGPRCVCCFSKPAI